MRCIQAHHAISKAQDAEAASWLPPPPPPSRSRLCCRPTSLTLEAARPNSSLLLEVPSVLPRFSTACGAATLPATLACQGSLPALPACLPPCGSGAQCEWWMRLLLLLAMANGTLNSECGTSPVRRENGGGGWHVRAKAGSLVALYLGALSLCVAPPSLAKFVCCGDGITKANKVCENWPHGK